MKTLALDEGLQVAQPASLRDPAIVGELGLDQLDLLVVAAYGLLLPEPVLAAPRLGCINIHASLLPRWRGAAPIVWAIAEGDERTGVCLMQMEAGLDTGPVYASQATPIRPQESAADLHDRLAQLGGLLLVDRLPALVAGELPATPQDSELATYARKLTREDGRIDWSLSAEVIARRVRAFDPYPGSTATLEGATVKIWHAVAGDAPYAPAAPGTVLGADATGIRVAAGEGSVVLTELQRPGRGRVDAEAFASAVRLDGARFGNGA